MLLPSLTTSGHEQVADPLTILTAASMTLYPAVSESGRGDVVGTGGGLAQSTQMTLGTSKSGWTSSAGQNTVVTGRPLTCEKKTFVISQLGDPYSGKLCLYNEKLMTNYCKLQVTLSKEIHC